MNNITYSILSKKSTPKVLGEDYLNDLYEYFEFASEENKFSLSLSKEDLSIIFSTIYEILSLRVDEEIVERLISHYLKLIIKDHITGVEINKYWFIESIWYLCVGVKEFVSPKEYNDCILFIQSQLLKKFEIKETKQEKKSRKLCVRYLTKFN